MKRRLLLIALVATAILAAAAVAWAQTSPDHDLSWHVLAPGGQEGTTSGTHSVSGTLGQFAVGPAAAAGGHSVGSGYWYGIGRFRQPVYEIYVPIVFKFR